MSQFYSSPSREDDGFALPDAEVFYAGADDFLGAGEDTWMHEALHVESERTLKQIAWDLAGWYWWPCLPGCLPDGDPIGPFGSKMEAIQDAQDSAEE